MTRDDGKSTLNKIKRGKVAEVKTAELALRYSAKSIVLPSRFSLYARWPVHTRYNFDGYISSVVPNLRFGESSRRNNGRVCAPNKLSARPSARARGRSMDTLAPRQKIH